LEFTGKDILVIGIKRSGLGAIELLRKHGARVRAMDAQPLTPDEQAHFDAMHVPVVAQEPENLARQGREPDLIVVSPAVPYDLPMLAGARQRGTKVIGEVELASYFLKGPVIGITGSNGKTTTTALTGHLLRECGIACQVGGNIGTAITSLVESSRDEQWNVVELSSFQLETVSRFRASIAACLNVTPDHLDRHHTFESYAAAKGRLFETQSQTDCAVLNYDDPTCRSFGEGANGQVYWFSASRPVPRGAWLEGDAIRFDGEAFLSRTQIKLRGLHNVENVMAGALMAHLAGAKLQDLARAVESFPGVEHRIEFVRELNGVEYFNDSKATNVDAALKAIDAFPHNLWIILGGKDKGSNYSPLRGPLQERAKAALLIGAEGNYPHAAAPIIREALSGFVPLVGCGTLERAVRYAREHARPGDTVLLAPACASFDQFQNYEERGSRFKHLVAELI
jgi:UDP-N-acetylmuramoylalanine--D-glutamate ligase